jgi:hypothetical protein
MKEKFEDLKKWAEQNKIQLIEANYTLNKSPLVELQGNEANSIDDFKKLSENLNAKVIVYDILNFEIENFNIYEETVNEIDEIELTDKFEKIKNFKNQIFGFTLFLFYEGITFKLENYIEETDIYLDVQSKVLDFIENNNSEDSIYKALSEEKAKEFGEKLASHENYPKYKTRFQREYFAIELFGSEFENLKIQKSYGASIVVSYAEPFYETKIKPIIEKELKLKITDLLGKGLTKIKVAAELGISKDTLNKYV